MCVHHVDPIRNTNLPVTVRLTSAQHGGTSMSCGTGDHSNCGPNCDCGCPYTGMDQRGVVEDVVVIEQRFPNTWLAIVIPPGEDEYHPDRGMLVAYGDDENEVLTRHNVSRLIKYCTSTLMVHMMHTCSGSINRPTVSAWL